MSTQKKVVSPHHCIADLMEPHDVHVNGRSGVYAWNPTYKHHHTPVWLSKRIRAAAIRHGAWRPSWTSAESFLDRDIFDHWGSVQVGEDRVMICQPYGYGYSDNQDQSFALKATLFAARLDIGHAISEHSSPYSESAYLIAFYEGDAGGSRPTTSTKQTKEL